MLTQNISNELHDVSRIPKALRSRPNPRMTFLDVIDISRRGKFLCQPSFWYMSEQTMKNMAGGALPRLFMKMPVVYVHGMPENVILFGYLWEGGVTVRFDLYVPQKLQNFNTGDFKLL